MATKERIRKTEGELVPRSLLPAISPWEDVERWFDEFGRQGWLHPFRWDVPFRGEYVTLPENRMPKVDIIDREEVLLIRAELPGVEKDGVDISVTDHNLILRAETKHEEKEEKGKYFRHEISRGEFQRTLRLPETVDEERAKATFSNGILEITLPKRERTPRMKVKVE